MSFRHHLPYPWAISNSVGFKKSRLILTQPRKELGGKAGAFPLSLERLSYLAMSLFVSYPRRQREDEETMGVRSQWLLGLTKDLQEKEQDHFPMIEERLDDTDAAPK